jgi:hypothetical protein
LEIVNLEDQGADGRITLNRNLWRSVVIKGGIHKWLRIISNETTKQTKNDIWSIITAVDSKMSYFLLNEILCSSYGPPSMQNGVQIPTSYKKYISQKEIT